MFIVSPPFLFWRIKSNLTDSADDNDHEPKEESFLDTKLMKSIMRALGMKEEERTMHALVRFILFCHEAGTPKYFHPRSCNYSPQQMQLTRNVFQSEIPAFAQNLECKTSLLAPWCVDT